jgi:hypothetical protein
MPWSSPQVRDLVIRTLIGEGAQNDPDSWASVANVMRNRALSGAYGDPNAGALTKVITAQNEAGNHQFTMWNADRASSGKTITPNDPIYQRAGLVADAVFNGPAPDNTSGADHYYAPGSMTVPGSTPSWAVGKTPLTTIGGQHFFKLGLGASDAITQAPTPTTSSPASNAGFVYGGASPQDPGVDTRHLEPVFAARIAKLQADAAAAGIKTHLTDGYRDNQSQAADYAKLGAQGLAAAPGSSYHQFGRAVDLVADDRSQQQALIALADQPGRGITAGAHFATPDAVHFQAAEGKTAPLVDTSSGAVPSRIGTDANAPLGTASPGAPAVSTIVPNPANLPARDAQTVSATAPSSSAGFVGPGSDKYSLVKSMTTGTSHNPQITTAADWGNLFGRVVAPAAAPPAAPAAASSPVAAPGPAVLPVAPPGSPLTPVQPDLSKDAPIGATGPTMPFLPNPFDNPAFSSSPAAPAAPTPAVAPAPVAPAPVAPAPVAPAPAPDPTHVPDWGPWHFGGTPSGPIIAHPWDRPLDLSQPPPQAPPDAPPPAPPVAHPWDAPMSMNQQNLPGSMMASAQNLIKLLFPSSVG